MDDASETLKRRGIKKAPASSSKEKTDKTEANAEKMPAKTGLLSALGSFCATQSFLILLTLRTVSVCVNLVWDCDETYNYWEPLHFILFGGGFQTWEYSPIYSLRSYAYIFMHAAPLYPLVHFFEKITLFYVLRFVFALVSTKLESYLYDSLRLLAKTNHEFERVSAYFLAFCFTNVGMFLSTTSFLPSTFSMYMVMWAYASWMRGRSKTAIFAIGVAVLLGWPFAVILGVPIAIDMCAFRGPSRVASIFSFAQWTLVFGALIALPMIAVDSYMFGKLVLAPLNIVVYNVFPQNPAQGPDIYGTEPLSFYIKNGLLNFNILFPMAYVSVFALAWDRVIKGAHKQVWIKPKKYLCALMLMDLY